MGLKTGLLKDWGRFTIAVRRKAPHVTVCADGVAVLEQDSARRIDRQGDMSKIADIRCGKPFERTCSVRELPEYAWLSVLKHPEIKIAPVFAPHRIGGASRKGKTTRAGRTKKCIDPHRS